MSEITLIKNRAEAHRSSNKNISRAPVHILFLIAAFFVASGDIFFVIHVPFTVRLSMVFLSLFMAISFFGLSSKKTVTVPSNYFYLLFWFSISSIAIIFSPTKYFSFFQDIFFLFNILLVFFVFNFVSRSTFGFLIKWYFHSFAFVALFGIFQWLVGLLGFNVLVTEWWKFDEIARVNGFNYEPSYFATYLSAGFVTIGYLRNKNINVVRHMNFYYYTILVAMLLSTSRMGIFLVAIWYSQYLVMSLSGLLRGRVIKRAIITIISMLMVLSGLFFVVEEIGPKKFLFLLTGVGLLGQSDSSVIQRSTEFYDTLNIFFHHPIFGVGIGGENYYMTGDRFGFYTKTIGILRKNPGINISAEALADSGLTGFICYLCYFYGFFKKLLSRSLQNEIVVALTLGLLAEMFLLQFNQDILRIYLWIHIAILSVAIKLFPPSRASSSALRKV